jgi:hypothetical protein
MRRADAAVSAAEARHRTARREKPHDDVAFAAARERLDAHAGRGGAHPVDVPVGFFVGVQMTADTRGDPAGAVGAARIYI